MIWPALTGEAAAHVIPSGELQVTACWAPAGPAMPAATKPFPAAVSVLTAPTPPGADSRICRQVLPPSADTTTTGASPALSTT